LITLVPSASDIDEHSAPAFFRASSASAIEPGAAAMDSLNRYMKKSPLVRAGIPIIGATVLGSFIMTQVVEAKQYSPQRQKTLNSKEAEKVLNPKKQEFHLEEELKVRFFFLFFPPICH
jgi:hypothetical protein